MVAVGVGMAASLGGWPGGVGLPAPHDIGPLDSLNSNPLLDIAGAVNFVLGDDNESNPYINSKLNTCYHDEYSFIQNFSGVNKNIFLSINIRSLMSNFNQFSSFIVRLIDKGINVIAIALQEIWAIPYPDLVQIPDFNLILKARSNTRGGGVGFYIRKTYNFKLIQDLSPFHEGLFESITIEVSQKNFKLILSNIYRSPTISQGQTNSTQIANFNSNLDNLLQNIYLRNSNSFIFMDANINLLKLSNSKPAFDYLETVHSNGFLQLISKASRISGESFSLIDHLLCKNYDNSYKTATLVVDISDHFMNCLAIPNNIKQTKTSSDFKQSRNMSLTNLQNFKNALHALTWREVLTDHDINSSFNTFWDTFSTLFELHFPIIKTKFNKNLHPKNDFMTPGLLISRSNKNRLYKLAINDSNQFLNKYRAYRNLFNTVLRASKKLHYETKFKQYAKNPKKTWELLNELTSGNKKKEGVSQITVDGVNITQPHNIANEFNKFFAAAGKKVAESVPPSSIDPISYLPYTNVPDLDLGHISSTLICDIIKSFQNKSSTDIDGVSLKLLKFINAEIREPLAHIFSLSIENGIFPTRLKNSRTVPIFKSGDTSNCDNYRPISLISSFSKILEKIVAVKLTNHLQLNKLLHEHQYGFQRSLSTEQNLIQVVNFIGKALNNGNFCIGIFLDLRKAFDSCSHDILLKKLEKLGIRGTALEWFSSYLQNRKQQVDINGALSSSLEILFGVLQGSNLGPLLFLCYINDIFMATDLATFLFADDTSCLAEHKNLHELVLHVNTELRKLANWFRANRMAVNISKTNYIIFHTKGKKVEMNGLNIQFDCNEMDTTAYDQSLKFNLERIHDNHPDIKMRYFKLLGVILDENLTFNKHASILCAKLSRSIFCMKG